MKDKSYELVIIGGGIAGAIATYICSKLNKKLYICRFFGEKF